MVEQAAVFKKTYNQYLHQLSNIDLGLRGTMLGVEYSGNTLIIPFYNHEYTISKDGVRGFDNRPNFALKVLLLKYVLSCPSSLPDTPPHWLSFKDFKDAKPLVSYFTANTSKIIEDEFSGKLELLKNNALKLGGNLLESSSYDLSIQFNALPRIPLILNFNDEDEIFPATCSILYHSYAEYFIDMECLTITGTYLVGKLLESAEGG